MIEAGLIWFVFISQFTAAGDGSKVARLLARQNFAKNLTSVVDAATGRGIFLVPPEAGPESVRDRSCTFGTANWNSILSRP